MEDNMFKAGDLLYVRNSNDEALVQLEDTGTDELGYHVLVSSIDNIIGSRGVFRMVMYHNIARAEIMYPKVLFTEPRIDLVDLHDAGLSHTCSIAFREKMVTFIRGQFTSAQPEVGTTPAMLVSIPIAVGAKVWWRSSSVAIENVTIDHYIINADSLHAVIKRYNVSSPTNRYYTVTDLSLINDDITKLI